MATSILILRVLYHGACKICIKFTYYLRNSLQHSALTRFIILLGVELNYYRFSSPSYINFIHSSYLSVTRITSIICTKVINDDDNYGEKILTFGRGVGREGKKNYDSTR